MTDKLHFSRNRVFFFPSRNTLLGTSRKNPFALHYSRMILLIKQGVFVVGSVCVQHRCRFTSSCAWQSQDTDHHTCYTADLFLDRPAQWAKFREKRNKKSYLVECFIWRGGKIHPEWLNNPWALGSKWNFGPSDTNPLLYPYLKNMMQRRFRVCGSGTSVSY